MEDIATSLGGNLHDKEVEKFVFKNLHFKITDPDDTNLNSSEKANIKVKESEYYLDVSLISQEDKRYMVVSRKNWRMTISMVRFILTQLQL